MADKHVKLKDSDGNTLYPEVGNIDPSKLTGLGDVFSKDGANGFTLNVGNGLQKTDDGNGNYKVGLKYDSSDFECPPAGLSLILGNGLYRSWSGTAVNLGRGLEFSYNGSIDVKLGTGLYYDSADSVCVKLGSGLKINSAGKIEVNLGSGLQFNADTGKIEPEAK